MLEKAAEKDGKSAAQAASEVAGIDSASTTVVGEAKKTVGGKLMFVYQVVTVFNAEKTLGSSFVNILRSVSNVPGEISTCNRVMGEYAGTSGA
jgi:hypothetical protein